MIRQLNGGMDEDAVWAAIDRQRLALAGLLDSLSNQEWDSPSLCTGWRIRDVAAHLALAHMSSAQAVCNLARAGGSFDRMIRDTARRHATVPAERVIAEIRSMVGSRRRAPGITPVEPLLDVLVHGQDIAVPLGRRCPMPPDAAAAAATRVWTVGWPMSTVFQARTRLRGLELLATDIDWSVGHGARVEGPIEALLLLLTGRSAACISHLSGAGVGRLNFVEHSPSEARDGAN